MADAKGSIRVPGAGAPPRVAEIRIAGLGSFTVHLEPGDSEATIAARIAAALNHLREGDNG